MLTAMREAFERCIASPEVPEDVSTTVSSHAPTQLRVRGNVHKVPQYDDRFHEREFLPSKSDPWIEGLAMCHATVLAIAVRMLSSQQSFHSGDCPRDLHVQVLDSCSG